MSISKFLFMDKQKIKKFLPDLFQILHSNMSLIAPTNNSYNDDFEMWISHIIPAMENEHRQIILMYVDKTLAGYFQYYISGDTDLLIMEEIQIKKEYQGTGLFSEFYKWLIKRLPENIMYVEAYANKKNLKSQSILKHLGLIELGENKNGNSFYYKGKYVDLLNRYS